MALDANLGKLITASVHKALEQILSQGFTGFQNEKDFEQTLAEKLRSMGQDWNWSNQAGHANNERIILQTDHWLNQNNIIPDIVGSKNRDLILIEVKYIPVNQRTGRPQDPPAFPYDILKDCLKLEMALENEARHARHPNIAFGLCIGLTNWRPYWTPGDHNGISGWSRNAFHIMRNPTIDLPAQCHTTPYRIDSYAKLMYRHKRPHLRFRYQWDRAWSNEVGGFRYITFSPTERRKDTRCIPVENITAGCGRRMPIERCHYLPFASIEDRNTYDERQRLFLA